LEAQLKEKNEVNFEEKFVYNWHTNLKTLVERLDKQD